MTLAQKLFWKLTGLTAGLLVAAGAVLACLFALQRLANTTREEFGELRQVRHAEEHLAEAVALLVHQQAAAAAEAIQRAIAQVQAFEEFQVSRQTALGEAHAKLERDGAAAVLYSLQALQTRLASTRELPPPATVDAGKEIETIRRAEDALARLSKEMEQAVAVVQVHTAQRFRITIWSLGVLFAAILLAAILINIRHYHSVVDPLRHLQDGARRLAQGELSARLEPKGDREFAELQADFNRMAEELESLYRDLERRVAEQSKRLAVSERLASVGFLAAGVAHEINNPLGIVSGYAESLLRRVRQQATEACSAEELRQGLEIIRDEAFRCKRITQGLLDLSRMGDQYRAPLSLWQLIDDAVMLAKAASDGSARTIEVRGDTSDALVVNGSGPELKQVVLNVVTNALEAVKPTSGRVELLARRANGWVELEVRDNGCGMSPETLAEVFEPFFTLSKGRNGIGLGLAISQAIVQRHGGTLEAASDGPDMGSIFTLRLPAHTETQT